MFQIDDVGKPKKPMKEICAKILDLNMVANDLINVEKSNKGFRKTRKKLPKWTKRVIKVRRITKVIKAQISVQ